MVIGDKNVRTSDQQTLIDFYGALYSGADKAANKAWKIAEDIVGERLEGGKQVYPLRNAILRADRLCKLRERALLALNRLQN